jgi:predicted actin-binding protein
MRKMKRLVLGLLVVSGVLAAGALAAAPQNQTPPSIDGKAMVGQTLTANHGDWSGSPTSYSYQWQRCDSDGSSCGDISGATTNKYKLTDSDVGTTVRVQVKATNSDGSSTENSKVTDVISGNAAPRATTQPSISGKAQVGETLTASPGKWAEGPSTFTYQWQLCDKSGANCKDITGATGQTYGVRSSDKDNTIRIQVTAKNLVGETTANSGQTDVVTAGTTPTPTPTPVGVGGAISITAISLPDRLVISSIQFSPRVITNRQQTITARFKVTEANQGKAVAGALVYAIAVPSNQVTRVGEVQTASNGWATMTFQPRQALPMKAGARVNFFVRARKSGENPLAGVSTRRLVSVGIHPVR